MRLFTPRFIKDIILIILFVTGWYILVNNPITHPIPEEVRGMWSIQLMQAPLVFGIAGHNFITLRNEKNMIVGELHGLATDEATRNWKYVGDHETDKLKVWYFSNPHEYITQKNYSGTIMYKGQKQDVVVAWQKALVCKEKINSLNIPYPPYGVKISGDTENSNSVAYTLILCMGLDANHLGLITPGWGKNLLDNH